MMKPKYIWSIIEKIFLISFNLAVKYNFFILNIGLDYAQNEKH